MALSASEHAAIARRYLVNTWLWYEFLLPACFFGLNILGLTYFDLPNPALAVFSSADLMPFAALLLLGVYREIDGAIHHQHLKKMAMPITRHMAVGLPVLILGAYGFMKYAAVTKSPTLLGSMPDSDLVNNAAISTGVTVLAGSFAYCARWRIIQAVLQRDMESAR